MSRPQRVSLSQGWCRRQPLYQKTRNEIWCNVMWWRSELEMLPGIETDRIWISTTLITTTTTRQRRSHRQTHGRHACLPVYLSVRICAIWWSPPKGIIERDFKYQKIHLPLRGSRNSVSAAVEGLEESVKPPAMFTLLRERSSVLAGTAFSDTHTFHPALQIYDLAHTHTHVITHAAL